MTTFHSLKVARVEPETRDAVTITFAIPQALQAEYCLSLIHISEPTRP